MMTRQKKAIPMSTNQSIESMIKSGDDKLKLGDYEGAIGDYTEALLVPCAKNNPKIFFQRSIAYSRNGNYENALKDSNTVVKLAPNNPDAYAHRGWIKITLSDYKGALDDLNKAIKLKPNCDIAITYMNLLYRISNLVSQETIDGLNARCKEIKPSFKTHASKAYLAFAEREIKEALGDVRKAIIYCDEAIRLNPENPFTWLCRADGNDKLGQHEQAERDRAKVIGGWIEEWHVTADEKFIKQEYDGAIEIYNKILRWSPHDKLALLNCAMAYFNSGCFNEALEWINTAIENSAIENSTHAQIADYYTYCAFIKSALHDYDGALTDCNVAIGLNPNSVIAYNHCAIIYRLKDDIWAAESDTKHARNLERHYYTKKEKEYVSNNYKVCVKSELKKENPNLNAALLFCNEAIRINGSRPDFYRNRAKVYHKMPEFKKAKMDYDFATFLTTYPKIGKELYTAIRKGQKDEALRCLKLYSEHAPNVMPITWTTSRSILEPAISTLAYYGHATWIDDFIENPAVDWNAKDELGYSVLHLAARQEHIDFFNAIVTKKLDNGNLPLDRDGFNPLHHAVLHGKTDFLLKVYELNENRKYFQEKTAQESETILHLLIRQRHTKALVDLLEKYPSFPVGEVNSKGQNAMMLAIQSIPFHEADFKLHYQLLELLCAHHADMYAQDQKGLTALHLAVKTNKIEMVEFVLAKTNKALIDSRDNSGKLPSDYTTPDSPIGILLERMKHENNDEQKDFSMQEHKWENLVFQGGSVKGLAYIGALRELEEKKVIDFNDIKRVGGTSAGAMTALLVGLGFSFDEIEHLSCIKTLAGSTLRQVKFSELLDGPYGEWILTAKNKDWSKEKDELQELAAKLSNINGPLSAIKAYGNGTITEAKTLKNKLENEFISIVKELNKNGGICPGKVLYNFCDEIIKRQLSKKLRKDIIAPVTFLELKKSGFKDLYFVGVNTNTGLAEIFSWEHTPHMLVANAVRISMSIPGVFTPVHMMIKEKGKTQQASNDLYVDGGILLNFPIQLFDCAIDKQGNLDREHPKINKSTLGLRLSRPGAEVKSDNLQKKSTVEWLADALKNLYKYAEDSGHLTSGDSFRTIYVNVDTVGMLDFELVDKFHIQDMLIQIGRNGVLEFIERTQQQTKPVYVTLPETLTKECQKHMVPLGQKVKNGVIKIKYKLNPNCPDLVVAFYKDDRNDLHRYLHHQLGISLFASDPTGMTAFHLAAMQGELNVLKRLLQEKPEGAYKKTKKGQTPYQLAREAGHTEIMTLLNNYTDEKSSQCCVSQFFKPAANDGSSSCNYYSMLLDEVKNLLEPQKINNPEIYSKYSSRLDKPSGDLQELLAIREALEREPTVQRKVVT